MALLIDEIKETIDKAIELDRSRIVMRELGISLPLYYFIMVHGLPKFGLRRHQSRQYITKLIEKEYYDWSAASKHQIIFDTVSRRIVEKDMK